MIGNVVLVLVVWMIVTFGAFVCIRMIRGKRRSFYGGSIFLVAALISFLSISAIFRSALACEGSDCISEKAAVESLLQFFIITWGAIGGNLWANMLRDE